MAFDPANVKLGKLEKRTDEHTLQLVRYIDTAQLPPAPAHWKWDVAVAVWPMHLNDQLGDCAIAESAHHIELWEAAAGRPVTISDHDVLVAYEAVSGYNPQTGANDNGAVILDVLNYWRHTGIAGHKIGAFAEVEVSNHSLMKDAIYITGGVDLGFQLPEAAQRMGTHWVKPHTLTGSAAPGSWGGHCVYGLDYDRYGMTVVSWGELIRVSWPFVDAYCDEAWAILSTDFVNGAGKTPNGVDQATLQQDLSKLGKVA